MFVFRVSSIFVLVSLVSTCLMSAGFINVIQSGLGDTKPSSLMNMCSEVVYMG
jgi:hypothetical protein